MAMESKNPGSNQPADIKTDLQFITFNMGQMMGAIMKLYKQKEFSHEQIETVHHLQVQVKELRDKMIGITSE